MNFFYSIVFLLLCVVTNIGALDKHNASFSKTFPAGKSRSTLTPSEEKYNKKNVVRENYVNNVDRNRLAERHHVSRKVVDDALEFFLVMPSSTRIWQFEKKETLLRYAGYKRFSRGDSGTVSSSEKKPEPDISEIQAAQILSEISNSASLK